MKIRSLVGFIGVVAMLSACSADDEKPAAQPATVNKDAAAANAKSTITALSATVGSSAGGASAGTLSAVAQSSQSLLKPSAGAPGTRSVGQALSFGPEEGGDLHPLDIGDPGCACTATSCTFSKCSFGTSSSGYSFTMDGSYSWDGGHIVCKDLKYTFEGSNLGGAAGYSTSTVVTLQCDMTITSTSINGFLQSSGSANTSVGGTGYTSTWDVKTTYNNVTFNASSHEPTGGSLHVEGTTSYSAGGQAGDYSGAADVSFP